MIVERVFGHANVVVVVDVVVVVAAAATELVRVAWLKN